GDELPHEPALLGVYRLRQVAGPEHGREAHPVARLAARLRGEASPAALDDQVADGERRGCGEEDGALSVLLGAAHGGEQGDLIRGVQRHVLVEARDPSLDIGSAALADAEVGAQRRVPGREEEPGDAAAEGLEARAERDVAVGARAQASEAAELAALRPRGAGLHERLVAPGLAAQDDAAAGLIREHYLGREEHVAGAVEIRLAG